MKVKVRTSFNADTIMQSVESDFSPINNITTQVIQLKDQAVIDALISLGWTPPKTSKEVINENN